MIGNILAPFEGVYIIPFDPDSVFDPTTHIATEENFIKLLEHGVYDSKYIGYGVTLSNTVDYNNGVWVIADVNHDSANTGQSNCYDLISRDLFHNGKFSDSGNSWRNDTPIRTWLNSNFYPGLSNSFKSHILNIKYKSQNTWYNDDKIIIPSMKEIWNSSYSAQDNDGVTYPLYNNDSYRAKKQFGTSTNQNWWTRSRVLDNVNRMFYVDSNGSPNNYTVTSYYYIAPLMRIQ